MTRSQIWNAFDLMQKACMATDSMTSREEFFAEPVSEQKAFYNWMRQQVGSFTAGPYWP